MILVQALKGGALGGIDKPNIFASSLAKLQQNRTKQKAFVFEVFSGFGAMQAAFQGWAKGLQWRSCDTRSFPSVAGAIPSLLRP
jgi:hypothetical protein